MLFYSGQLGAQRSPRPGITMEAFEVNKDVGNVKNNSPELLNSRQEELR
jgi:hypothetical protein